MSEQEYLTVGQLARKVGTTVRTIQYYDQRGLLSPSAQGPGNQRLYAPEAEVELRRILTLKYLGLSLADIKAQQGQSDDAEAFRATIAQTMEALEDDFNNLLKRLSVLRTITAQLATGSEVDWAAFAQVIEEGEADEAPEAVDTQMRSEALAHWHELVAETIALMDDNVDPADPRAAEVARRYHDLTAAGQAPFSSGYSAPADIPHHPHGPAGSFGALRERVLSYLEEVRRANDGEDAAL